MVHSSAACADFDIFYGSIPVELANLADSFPKSKGGYLAEADQLQRQRGRGEQFSPKQFAEGRISTLEATKTLADSFAACVSSGEEETFSGERENFADLLSSLRGQSSRANDQVDPEWFKEARPPLRKLKILNREAKASSKTNSDPCPRWPRVEVPASRGLKKALEYSAISLQGISTRLEAKMEEVMDEADECDGTWNQAENTRAALLAFLMTEGDVMNFLNSQVILQSAMDLYDVACRREDSLAEL